MTYAPSNVLGYTSSNGLGYDPSSGLGYDPSNGLCYAPSPNGSRTTAYPSGEREPLCPSFLSAPAQYYCRQ